MIMPATEEFPSQTALPPATITPSEWALILVLVAIQFTHMVDFVIIMPLGKRLLHELQLNAEQFGHIVSAYAWAAGFTSLLASFVMDRFDRKQVLLTMYAGFALSTLFCGFADDYVWLLVSRTLAGGFGGTAAVALTSIIGDVFPPEKRGRASGAVMSAFAVASIAGLPTGLVLAEHFGRGAPFLALAVLAACVWILAWARLPPITSHLSAQRPDRLREFADVVSNRRYLGAFMFSFFLVLGTFTVGSFVGPYVATINGWSEQELAQIYFVAGTVTLCGMTLVGWLSDRMPRLRLFRVLGVGALVMALVVTNLPRSSLAIAALAISGFMVLAAGRMVPVQALLLGVPRPENRGAFMSVYTAIQHTATGLAPLVTGSLVTIGEGTMTGFPKAGLFAAATAAISLVLAGSLRHAPTDLSPLDAEDGSEFDEPEELNHRATRR
jgi:predicted MFS family arabinose efflux permease